MLIYSVLYKYGFDFFLENGGIFYVISANYVTFLLVISSYFLYLRTQNKALAENGKNKKIRIGTCSHPLQAT